tara:strand:- start:9215 stop:11920 length:2706 start_codon:yes stop_codon:yes gene_type:complete
MAWKKYSCKFFSQNKVGGDYTSPSSTDANQQQYEIAIWKETGTDEGSTTFKCTEEGFVLTMDGGGDNIASPIKTTSIEFDMIIEGASQGAIIDDILSVATGNEDEFYVTLSRYDVSNTEWVSIWTGPLLGDLVSVQDVGINNIVKVKATDGITQLKYKNFDIDTNAGVRSLLYIIKKCLAEIPLTSARFGATDAYIAHTPNFYSKGMAGGLTGSNAVDSATWRENVSHDPLALTLLNVELFRYDDGTSWSCYHILEQILSCMQLRIMMCEIDDGGTGHGAMWFIQSPFIYHDSAGALVNENLLFLHGNTDDDDALSYINDFSTALLNPNKRTTGSLTTYTAPMLSYKSIYNHKIMDNLIHGPLSFNSYQYSIDNTTPADDLTLDTGTNFSIPIARDTSANAASVFSVGNVGDDEPSTVRLLLTGIVNYFPYHWSAWDFYNENNQALSSFGDWTRVAYIDQNIYWRMGITVQVNSTWSSTNSLGEPEDFDVTKNYNLGDTRQGYLFGSIPWIGPSESDAGAGNYYAGFWDTTWPNVEELTTIEGTTFQPWGSDWGYSKIYWDQNTVSVTDTDHFHWFSPMYMYLNANLVGTADSYAGFSDGWQSYSENTKGPNEFAIYSPPIPMPTEAGAETPPSNSNLKKINLYYALKRDMWDNDGSNDYWTCALDWSNQKELLHENRGIGYGCNLQQVRLYVVSNKNQNDGYYDYSIGSYTNNNGTPSDGDVQDPEILMGDDPNFHTSQISNISEGLSQVYFGQFFIKNTNALTNTNEPYYIDEDSQKWINIWEDLSTGDPQKLHIKRAKNQVSHHYKIKQRLDLNFIDRSVGYNSVTDYRLSSYGFSGLYFWKSTGSNQTENTDWEDINFIPTGGTFVAGTMEWQFQFTDASTFSESNLTDSSYNTNNV